MGDSEQSVMDTGEHRQITDIEVIKERVGTMKVEFEKHEREVWMELNKIKPMVWKMWAVATALPAIISVASYMVFKNG